VIHSCKFYVEIFIRNFNLYYAHVFVLTLSCKREPRNRPRRTHRVSGGRAQLLNFGTRRWCDQHHALAAFTPGKDPVPTVQEARWAPEPVWIGAENLAPPGFDPRTFQPVASRYTD
jgi:hypothetical protein